MHTNLKLTSSRSHRSHVILRTPRSPEIWDGTDSTHTSKTMFKVAASLTHEQDPKDAAPLTHANPNVPIRSRHVPRGGRLSECGDVIQARSRHRVLGAIRFFGDA